MCARAIIGPTCAAVSCPIFTPFEKVSTCSLTASDGGLASVASLLAMRRVCRQLCTARRLIAAELLLNDKSVYHICGYSQTNWCSGASRDVGYTCNSGGYEC
jgi:hypothetical protein